VPISMLTAFGRDSRLGAGRCPILDNMRAAFRKMGMDWQPRQKNGADRNPDQPRSVSR
jgi:hypothetical protein